MRSVTCTSVPRQPAYASMMSRSVLSPVPLQDLAHIHSSATFKSLAAERPYLALSRLSKAQPLAARSGARTIADLFNVVYEAMVHSYRNEYVYKNTVVSKVVYGRHSPSTAGALIELPLGRSISDVVIFNGTSTAYEIKTDLDSFSRISTQLSDYCTRVENVFVVVSEKRAKSAELRVPENVGLIMLRKRGTLSEIRPSISNIAQLRSDHIFEGLRQAEVSAALRRQGIEVEAGNPVDQWHISRDLFCALNPQVAHTAAVSAYKARTKSALPTATSGALPWSARALAYSSALSGAAHRRLIERLAAPLESLMKLGTIR